ncbi:unnamed protein product [Bemisia tabaci]|nr:unnamed protein product [Bemisia tabaci]
MELQNLEESGRMRPYEEIHNEMTSEQEEWFDGPITVHGGMGVETDSCKICQKFLQTRRLKNMYKTRYYQLLEEFEQTINSLKASFEEAKQYFKILIENPLDLRPEIQSHKYCVTNQLADQCTENANLHLEIRKLNRLLRSAEEEQEKERSRWRRALEERERTIATLRDNIYYFIRKLKFKRNPGVGLGGVIKRTRFKRNIKNILSSNTSNMCNIRLFAGKLISPDSSNVNYHFYYKNKFEGSNADFQSSVQVPSESSQATLMPLTLHGSSDQACSHRAILQERDISECASRTHSLLESLPRASDNDEEESCHCDASELSAPETTGTDFSRNRGLPRKKQDRTKHSIVFRRGGPLSREPPRVGSLSKGDAGNFGWKRRTKPCQASDEESSSAGTSISEDFLGGNTNYSSQRHAYQCHYTDSDKTLTEDSDHGSEERGEEASKRFLLRDSFEPFDIDDIPQILAASFPNRELIMSPQAANETNLPSEFFSKQMEKPQYATVHSRLRTCLSTVQEMSNESDLSQRELARSRAIQRVYPSLSKSRMPRELVGEETETEDEESEELESILGSEVDQTAFNKFLDGLINIDNFPLRTESAPAKLQSVSPDLFL